MKIVQWGETVNVSEVEELAAASAASFQSQLAPALDRLVSEVAIDLRQTRFVDCGGLGALAATRKTARERNPNVTFRLLNPPATLERMLKVTRMDQVFPCESPDHAMKPALALAAGLMSELVA